MVSQRALEVLRVIVEDYVDSREPVGSKAIVERHDFGVSSATIRNDMALLEEANLIHAPHTSSGRVPTDLGYRRFVDSLSAITPLTSQQILAIHRFLDESLDVDDFYGRSVKLLSDLTNQVALVQFPTLGNDKAAHVELVSVSPSKAFSVLITTAGSIDRRMVDFDRVLDDETIADLRARVASAVAGVSLGEIDGVMAVLVTDAPPALAPALEAVRLALRAQVDSHRKDKLIVAGTPKLVRSDNDFARTVAPVLDAIEEQVTLLRLFGEMRDAPHDSGVRIGREMIDDLSDAAIVSRAYSSTGGDSARVAILGPTRMNYPLNMAAVDAVARYLSQVLGDED
jgi:heat-inducible transcriptional repressor